MTASKKGTGKRATKARAKGASGARAVAKQVAAEAEAATNTRIDPEGDTIIFRAWLRSSDIYDLAQAFDKNPSTIRRIVNTMKVEGQRAAKQSPMQIARDLVMKYEALISELAAVASSEKGATRVLALSVKGRRMDKLTELLQKVGYLPHDLAVLAVQLNGIRAGEQMIEILEKFDVPEEAFREIEGIWADTTAVEIEDEEFDVPMLPEAAGA